MNTDHFQTTIKLRATRAIGQANINAKSLTEYKVPLPSLDSQKQIVAQLEEVQKLVAANKRLIEIFEQKIKDKVAEVWGELDVSEAEVTIPPQVSTFKQAQRVQQAEIEQPELGLSTG